MKNQMILFGSGEIGTEAFSFLGSEVVAFFCDNDCDIAGTEKCGKRIISFAELKKNYSNFTIMISANRVNSEMIVRQCEENGISDYLVYERLKDKFESREELLIFLQKPLNRLQLKMELYQDKVNELRQEVNYFKHHADIRGMKPAMGKLRDRQLKTARASAELFRSLEGLDIKPYITGGNLLGYMRHGGFIPWDDDIDFDLIRNEFERLKAYCMAHMYSKQEFEHMEGRCKEGEVLPRTLKKGMEKYYWVDWLHHFQVNVTFPDGDSIGVDFFPIDYYAESCSFSEFIEFVKQTKREWELAADSTEKRVACIETAKRKNQKNVVEESGRIYFGADNLANFRSYHRGDWIPASVVFPLKQVSYEGESFWIPNQMDEYVKYLFESIEEFPEDNIAIPKHYLRHRLMEEKE